MKTILACIIAILVALGLGYWKGSYDAGVETALQVSAANNVAREKEKQIGEVAATYATVLRKKEKDAEKKITNLRIAVANGERKLFIPVTTKASDCSVSTTSDASTSSGSNSGETRAELNGQVAQDLISIVAEGDSVIRKLNVCISQYNEIKDKLNDPVKH
jgi:hypothetical protein